jgi:hypothetical protein
MLSRSYTSAFNGRSIPDRLIGLHEWRATCSICRKSTPQSAAADTDSGSFRRTVNAREDGQALGFDFGFKPIHRFLWSEATENDRQSVWRQRISRAGKAPARLGSV